MRGKEKGLMRNSSSNTENPEQRYVQATEAHPLNTWKGWKHKISQQKLPPPHWMHYNYLPGRINVEKTPKQCCLMGWVLKWRLGWSTSVKPRWQRGVYIMYRNPQKRGEIKKEKGQEDWGMKRNSNVLICIHKYNSESPRTRRFFNVMVYALAHVYLCPMQVFI